MEEDNPPAYYEDTAHLLCQLNAPRATETLAASVRPQAKEKIRSFCTYPEINALNMQLER